MVNECGIWKAWDCIRNGGMEALVKGAKNDFTKPGLTSNVPSWAKEIINKNAVGILLETADPAKFGATVKQAIGKDPVIPERLQKIMNLPDQAIPMENDYNKFKDWLMATL